jgi:hypothetical protein
MAKCPQNNIDSLSPIPLVGTDKYRNSKIIQSYFSYKKYAINMLLLTITNKSVIFSCDQKHRSQDSLSSHNVAIGSRTMDQLPELVSLICPTNINVQEKNFTVY